MADEIRIKIGTKIEPEEAKSLDPGKRGQTAPVPQKGDEVQAQEYWAQQAIGCPWCGATNWLWVSDTYYYWYTCWNCGNPFRC